MTERIPKNKASAVTAKQVEELCGVLSELEWVENITNEKTRRAYMYDVREFFLFTGTESLEELRTITQEDVIAWRKDIEARALSPASIRRKLSALSSLFDYLRGRNAVARNPVDGVERPLAQWNERNTPALGDTAARKLIEGPPTDTLKGMRDRAVLVTLLYHGMRRGELCSLRVSDIQNRDGVKHFRIKGRCGKIRFVPVHAMAQRLIEVYLLHAGHGSDLNGPLFRPVKNQRTGVLRKALAAGSIYELVRQYGLETGVSAEMNGLCAESLRVTAGMNAIFSDCDMARVQEWLGLASVYTTRAYDRRKTRPEENPTLEVKE